MKTIHDVQEATTKDLVAFYNAHNLAAPIAKFSDRKTAERRVMAIIVANAASEEAGVVAPELPAAEVHKTRASRQVNPEPELETGHVSDTPEDEVTEAEARAELELMKAAKTKGPVIAKSGLTLGQAIAASWLVPETAAKRMTRNGVTVSTQNGGTAEFKSVAAAFGELGLPMSKHIRFRMKLKAAGSMVFEFNNIQYHFSTDDVVLVEADIVAQREAE